MGGDSVGKTSLLLEIAHFHPDAQIIILDFENKVEKIMAGYYPDLTNVRIEPILGWSDVPKAFDQAKRTLKAGDWLMMDGLDKAWDMAQLAYVPSKENPDAWQWIKGQHNKEFMDPATGRAPFHVAASAWAQPNPVYNINREAEHDVKEDLMRWREFGFRPGGEKRNTSRFDTVFALKAELRPLRHYVATYKDKVRPMIDGGSRSLWLQFEFPFWPLYVAACEKAKEQNPRTLIPQ